MNEQRSKTAMVLAGGGIMGAPGRIAALEYLKHKKKGRRAA